LPPAYYLTLQSGGTIATRIAGHDTMIDAQVRALIHLFVRPRKPAAH
jgi:hypothetical protein